MVNEVYNSHKAAIVDMRKASTNGIPFSIQYKKLDGGDSYMNRARLLHSSKIEKGKYILNLMNLDNEELRRCYIPLIVAVNNKQIKLQ